MHTFADVVSPAAMMAEDCIPNVWQIIHRTISSSIQAYSPGTEQPLANKKLSVREDPAVCTHRDQDRNRSKRGAGPH